MARFFLLACLAAKALVAAAPFPPALGFFREGPLHSEIYAAHTQPSPFDESQPLEKRARSYLAIHCSVCHQPRGVLQGNLDLRFTTPLPLTGLFALSGRRDAEGKSLQRARIRPGKPEDSDIYQRLRSTGSDAMPPLGRTSPDESGLALIRAWIVSLQSMAPTQMQVLGLPSEQNQATQKKVYRVMPANTAGTCQAWALSLASEFSADTVEMPCRQWGVGSEQRLPRGRYEMKLLGQKQQEKQIILLVL